jgi:hypothetical protein
MGLHCLANLMKAGPRTFQICNTSVFEMKNESLPQLHNIKYVISNSCFKQSDKHMNYLIQR